MPSTQLQSGKFWESIWVKRLCEHSTGSLATKNCPRCVASKPWQTLGLGYKIGLSLVDGSADVLPAVPRVHPSNIKHDKTKVRDSFNPGGVRERLTVELPLNTELGVIAWCDPALKVYRHSILQPGYVLPECRITSTCFLNSYLYLCYELWCQLVCGLELLELESSCVRAELIFSRAAILALIRLSHAHDFKYHHPKCVNFLEA